MEKHFDHIGIAVRNIEESINFHQNVLGATLIDRYRNEGTGVESEIAIMDVNGFRTELLMPTNNTTSPIARFIKQKGKGVHHVAYRVADLNQTMNELEDKGVRILEGSLRTNKHGRRLLYVNPIDTEGTIIEYCDYPNQ